MRSALTMTLPRLNLLNLLLDLFPRFAYLWLRWADRWKWLDAGGEAERLDQYARAKRYGKRAARKHRNKAAASDDALDVEVLVTVYKYKDYVEQAVTSAQEAVEALRKHGWRGGIALVEDCGEDGSWELACELADASLVPMRLLQPAKNIGLTGARNLALMSSRSKAVFVLDADNKVYPEGLVNLWQLMQREHATAAYGPLDVLTTTGESMGWVSDRPPDRQWMMTEGNHIDAMALFDTTVLQRAGGWDPQLLKHCWGLEDYELWVRLMRANKHIAFHPEPVGQYLLKDDSMARTMNPRTWSSFCAYMRAKHSPEFQVS